MWIHAFNPPPFYLLGEEHAQVEPAAEGLPDGDEPGGAAGAAHGPAGRLCRLPGDGEGSSQAGRQALRSVSRHARPVWHLPRQQPVAGNVIFHVSL